MRVVLTSDIHVGSSADLESKDIPREPFDRIEHEIFAKEIHDRKPDVLIVTGDCAENYAWPDFYWKEFFQIYKNPHGVSICIPGNHDVWISRPMRMTHEQTFQHFFEVAQENGWVGIKDEPWSKDGVWVAGGMGWYDFSLTDPAVQMLDVKNRQSCINFDDYARNNRKWSDYYMMQMHRALNVNELRMKEFEANLAKVPPPDQRKALIVISHFIGFSRLMGGFPSPDFHSAFFGNSQIGMLAVGAEADYYFCGHSHRRKEFQLGKTYCLNNGSGYGRGSKHYDVFEV